jgi:hypothetical protein
MKNEDSTHLLRQEKSTTVSGEARWKRFGPREGLRDEIELGWRKDDEPCNQMGLVNNNITSKFTLRGDTTTYESHGSKTDALIQVCRTPYYS